MIHFVWTVLWLEDHYDEKETAGE